jgi:hypothetical protein
MFIITGTYNWRPRLVAFRRDYCRRCQDETLAIAHRSVDVFHVFWIPVLPLGIWTRWRCNRCGRNPHDWIGVRRPVRILLLITLALITALLWIMPIEEPAEAAFTWTARGLGSFATLAALWWSIYYKPEGPWRTRLAAVRPHAEPDCPLCGGRLLASPDNSSCAECGAEHRPLKRKDDELRYHY